MNEIILELTALLLTAFCLIYSVTARRKLYFPMPKGMLAVMKSQHISFLIILFAVVISAASSVAGRLGELYRANAVTLEFLHTVYYFFHNMLSVFFALYILDMTGPVREQGRKFFFCFCLPLVLGELLILSNPLTHLCFYVDAEMVYHRGTYLWILYAIAAVYIVTGYLYFFRFFRTSALMSDTDRVAMLMLITVALVGVVIQAIWSVPVELFFEAIAFLGFMVLVERDPDRDASGPDRQFSGSLIIAVALAFLAVIIMNVSLILNLNSTQSDEIGNVQLEVIRSDLENAISEAETNVLRVAIGAEQALDSGKDRAAVEAYFDAQRSAFAVDKSVICVYIGGEDWHYTPDFDAPADYRASERDWYRGAIVRPGEVYITEPYKDANTGVMCFTVSTALSDGRTVVAMDLNFTEVQESIRKMTNGENQTAMIVTSGGRIAGYTDMSLVGQRADEAFPEYAEVLRRVASSKEHGSFHVRLNGRPHTVFSTETGNGWYLILSVNTYQLYAGSYRQIGMMAAVNLLMLVTVLVFYMVSTRSRLRTAETLAEKERFIAGLSGKLREPVLQILRLSDWQLMEESSQPGEFVRQIKESGLQLSEAVNDIQSYSGMLRQQETVDHESAKKPVQATGALSRKLRNSVILTLLFAMLIALFFAARSTVRLGSSHMNREADGYANLLNSWLGERQGVVKMITGLFSSRPALLADYDGTVMMLDGIAGKYPEITACFFANPDAPHPLIVNGGRQPDERIRTWTSPELASEAARAADTIRISAPFVDGETGERCITLSRAVFDEAGSFLGVFGIDCSIEQPLRALREHDAGMGYAFLVDADGNIISHPNAAHQFSEDRRVSIEDTEYAEAYHSENVSILRDFSGKLVSCISRTMASGFTVVVANRAWRIYGSMILLSLAALGLFAVCIIFIVALINRLIRWQEEVNRQLMASADAAVNAGKAKSSFLAQMSHEIRTPINAVLGMNEMILRESREPETLEYAGNIETAGHTLLGLINSILDFSKIEDGKMELVHVRYETNRFIDELVNMISDRAERKGLELKLDIDPTIPGVLYGDDMRIRQIITNLLTNAVKYTPAGTVTMTIRLLSRTEDRCELFVSVADTGIGIREEDIGRLFDSFQRLDQERNRGIEGTGLGIAIVQRLLAMMDSRLDVQSVYGEGSTFSFRLAQQVVDWRPIGAYEPNRAAAAPEQHRKSVWAPTADVLVVDDNDMNLKVAKGLLKHAGISPELAESGAQCLEMTARKHYDIIFLDHMMPEMDGIQTLQALRARGDLSEDTAVIVLTANAVAGAREEYLKAGFRDYLSKPIEVEELDRMLSKYLPESKLGWKTDGEPAPAVPAAEKPAGTDVMEALDAAGVHTGTGLRYVAGKREFYLELLRAFAEEQSEKAQAIRADCDNANLKDYRIRVHALKGIARQIGADALADRAQAQENAAKTGDAVAVEAGCAPLLEYYRQTAEAIRAAIGARGTPQTAPAGEEIEAEALRETLDEALTLLDNFESTRAAALLKPCAARTFRGRALHADIEAALRALDDFEPAAAAERLRALRKTI